MSLIFWTVTIPAKLLSVKVQSGSMLVNDTCTEGNNNNNNDNDDDDHDHDHDHDHDDDDDSSSSSSSSNNNPNSNRNNWTVLGQMIQAADAALSLWPQVSQERVRRSECHPPAAQRLAGLRCGLRRLL
eukprot:6395021-Amphidinium_carterae.1